MTKKPKSQLLTVSDLTVSPTDALMFSSSDELEPFNGTFGQKRALSALDFGLAIERCGYNIFVSGMSGTGRLTLTTNRVRAKAIESPALVADFLYLPNFSEPKHPRSLQLSAGQGRPLVEAIERFIDKLVRAHSASIESPAYQREKASIDRAFDDRYGSLLNELAHEAKELNIYLNKDGDAITFSPLLGDEPASEEEFAEFPETEQAEFTSHVKILESRVLDRLAIVPHWRRESREQLTQLQQSAVSGVLDPLMTDLRKRFAQPELQAFFDALSRFLSQALMDEGHTERSGDSSEESARRLKLQKDCVPRLFVENLPGNGQPVVVESNPTLRNLFGYAESITEQGSVVTRHNLIYPGALHLANGGYLIMEADKIISEPQVWPALKRTLKNRRVRIETTAQDLSLTTPVSMNPEEIPLKLKVVLIGSSELFYALQELDDEFIELFRILCDFEEDIPRSAETELLLIRLINTQCQAQNISAFTRNAAEKIIHHSCRLADDQNNLSVRVGDLIELMAEADLLRLQSTSSLINREHIDNAIEARKYRLSRLSEAVLREIVDGSILIETEGASIGRVNGLTVIDFGSFQFGNPARISATVFPGSRGVVDIEREVELGEAIHSKGVMILTGYLGQRYARELKMAFSANLALEQSYGHVDGDSASLAELCALISALAECPIKQGIAVTGSINQYGEVQPVGGINEKIEGFFELCLARGLSGKQGVIIPHINKRHLVLDDSVVAAVRDKLFNIWIVETVDETLRLLTGKSTAHLDKHVLVRLKALSELSEDSDL